MVYAIIRYCLFFLKYSTVNYALNSHEILLEICRILVSDSILNQDRHLITIYYVIQNYYGVLLLIVLGIMTRQAFTNQLNHFKRL